MLFKSCLILLDLLMILLLFLLYLLLLKIVRLFGGFNENEYINLENLNVFYYK